MAAAEFSKAALNTNKKMFLTNLKKTLNVPAQLEGTRIDRGQYFDGFSQ
jgi:hypothetical protein